MMNGQRCQLMGLSTCLNSITVSSSFNESSALASCYSKEKVENNNYIVIILTSLPPLLLPPYNWISLP